MGDSPAPFLGIEQLQQYPHLHQWLGLSIAGTVELGHIVGSPLIRAATSITPLGWVGTPGEKSADLLKVDVVGSGLHMCNRVQAQVNGKWYVLFVLFSFVSVLWFTTLYVCQKNVTAIYCMYHFSDF